LAFKSASAAKPRALVLTEPGARQKRVASRAELGRLTSPSAEREVVKVGGDQGDGEAGGDEQHSRHIAPAGFFAKFRALRRV